MKYAAAEELIKGIEQLKANERRGPLAMIRRGSFENGRMDALSVITEFDWPYNESEARIVATVCAAFVVSGCVSSDQTFGSVCGRLKDESPVLADRFRALLTTSDPDDFCEELRSILHRLGGAPLNWTRLLFDAANWAIAAEDVRARWTADFFRVRSRTETAEENAK